MRKNATFCDIGLPGVRAVGSGSDSCREWGSHGISTPRNIFVSCVKSCHFYHPWRSPNLPGPGPDADRQVRRPAPAGFKETYYIQDKQKQ